MAEIVLSTLNARYAHSSFGLRYLRANLGPYRESSEILEFIIKKPTDEIVSEILARRPKLVGFGVYIWNAAQTLAVVKKLRNLAPDVMIVVGGPEVSYEIQTQDILNFVDYVFQGESDFLFRDFVARWKAGDVLSKSKVITGARPSLDQLALPYAEYTNEDVAHRKIYVEASRGCPYRCEYCLSSLDEVVRNFSLDIFLKEMQRLLDRGVRQFKFVDRTFNLSPSISRAILQFFLDQVHLGLFLHFEMVPDRLPEDLKNLIRQFPEGSLQFEIGIQTWNPEVGRNVSRRQDYQKICENFEFLQTTGVHTHADLIVGLPGENMTSFAKGFEALLALQPHEIQVGLLKRLKGTPLTRNEVQFGLVFSEQQPFEILETACLGRAEVAALSVFADFWDAVGNSGRYQLLLAELKNHCLLDFKGLKELFDFLFARIGRTHSIHLADLDREVHNFLSAKLSEGVADNWIQSETRRREARNSIGKSVPNRQKMHRLTDD